MANFSLGSEINPFEMTVAIAQRRLKPELKILKSKRLKNPQKVHVIQLLCQPGLKRQREHAPFEFSVTLRA